MANRKGSKRCTSCGRFALHLLTCPSLQGAAQSDIPIPLKKPGKKHKCDQWTCDFCEKKTCLKCGGVISRDGEVACKDCKKKEGIKGVTKKEMESGGL